MKIECVVVAVDYADYLEQTLPYTISVVDSLTVVTSPEDGRTRRLCSKYGVTCLPTRCFYQDGDRFNKARGINYGLANMRLSDWVLHMDADIVLPLNTRWMLSKACLDPTKLYGVDRVRCQGRAEWDRFKANPELQFEWGCLVKPPFGWTMGARIAHQEYGGYCPIGFFQLWHSQTVKRYPFGGQGDAEHTDVLHAIQWDRPDRVLLPEILAIHLETTGNKRMGDNWKGRKTPEFTVEETPYVSAQAAIGVQLPPAGYMPQHGGVKHPHHHHR